MIFWPEYYKMTEKVSVKNFQVKNIKPVVPQYAAKYLPTVLTPQSVSFELHGVNIAIANGIRRVIEGEFPTKSLNFDIDGDNFETNDPFVLNDFIRTRIRCIPVHQSIKKDSVFSIDVLNTSHQNIEVKSSAIKPNPKLFDETISITELLPNKYIKIKKIYVDEGQSRFYGGFTVSSGSACVVLDVKPLNMYTRSGTPASEADPRSFRITFDTNGTIEPKKIVTQSCDEIIKRLAHIKGMLYKLVKTEDIHQLRVEGENDTTGNILMKTICDIFPDIPSCVYLVNLIDKSMTINLRTSDPVDVLESAIAEATKILEKIKSSVS